LQALPIAIRPAKMRVSSDRLANGLALTVECTDCPPDPGFAGAVTFDFGWSSSWVNSPEDTWTIDDEKLVEFHQDDKALEIMVNNEGQEAWVSTRQYLLFGKVTFEVEAAAGQGVVTALVLKSDSGDEIDWVGPFMSRLKDC
jgi:hypothetical protein